MRATSTPDPTDAEVDGSSLHPGVAEGVLGFGAGDGSATVQYLARGVTRVPDFPATIGWVVEVDGPPPRGLGVPAVGGIDRDVVRAGDLVRVDGDRGSLTLRAVTRHDVVTAFLERPDGRILVLRRSNRVGSFRGHWAGVSGFLEDPTPEGQAVREVHEETGVAPSDLALAARGRLVFARDGDRIFAIHPFRFRVGHVAVRLDWEHTEFAWIPPVELSGRRTVPKLTQVWERVAPPRGEAAAAEIV